MKAGHLAKFKPLIDFVCSALESSAAHKRQRGHQHQDTPSKSGCRRTESGRTMEPDGEAGSGADAMDGKPQQAKSTSCEANGPLVFTSLLSLRIEECSQLTAVELAVPSLCKCEILKCPRLERVALSFASQLRLMDCSGCSQLQAIPFAVHVVDAENHSSQCSQRLLPGGRWGAHLEKAGRSLQQLRAAGLRDCALLDEEFIRKLLDYCRQLVRIDIVGTAASPSLGGQSTRTKSRSTTRKNNKREDDKNKQDQKGPSNAGKKNHSAGTVGKKKNLCAGWRQRPSGRTDHRTKVKTTGWLQKLQLARPALEVLYNGKKSTASTALLHHRQRKQCLGQKSWQSRWLAEGGEV
jgi:hypothetical protein